MMVVATHLRERKKGTRRLDIAGGAQKGGSGPTLPIVVLICETLEVRLPNPLRQPVASWECNNKKDWDQSVHTIIGAGVTRPVSFRTCPGLSIRAAGRVIESPLPLI